MHANGASCNLLRFTAISDQRFAFFTTKKLTLLCILPVAATHEHPYTLIQAQPTPPCQLRTGAVGVLTLCN